MNANAFNALTPRRINCFGALSRVSRISRFKFFAFFALFAVNFFAVAAPKIQFAAPILDFGRIKCGEIINHTFIFTNIGEQTLEISDVRPSCGCTTAGVWDRSVEPGKVGRIPIQFNSGRFDGAVGKTVIVLCNDPVQTNIVLQIKGTIWKPVEITPAMAWFGSSSDSQTNETRRIQIVSNLQEALELSQPECTNEAFLATLRTVRPGKEFELAVTFLHAKASGTTISAPITLKTTSTNVPLLTITANALVQPAVVASPAQLALPTGPLASGIELNANILNNGANPLVLSDPSIEPPVGKIRVQELKSGRQFVVTADFPTGLETQPGQIAEIRVKTNHPQYPVVKIPIMARQTLATALRESEASQPAAKPTLKSTTN